jgi:hypothetical protein
MIEVLGLLIHILLLIVLWVCAFGAGRATGHLDYLKACRKYLDEASAMHRQSKYLVRSDMRLFDFLHGIQSMKWYWPFGEAKIEVDESEEYVELRNRVVADPVGQEKA